jgi:hypothetical protein
MLGRLDRVLRSQLLLALAATTRGGAAFIRNFPDETPAIDRYGYGCRARSSLAFCARSSALFNVSVKSHTGTKAGSP